MFYERIKKAESSWSRTFDIFWEARRETLPVHLRLEDNPLDGGLCKRKQNHYRLTGEVIMMGEDFKEYKAAETWVKKHILIVGCCGTGKTWVMRQLLEEMSRRGNVDGYKLGMINFATTGNVAIVGNYDGSTFEGSDRLSMAAINDASRLVRYAEKEGTVCIWEGDRWMNSRFIETSDPYIIKIEGDGAKGREKRGILHDELKKAVG